MIQTLRARIKAAPLHLSEAAAIIDDIFAAITKLHAEGLIDRARSLQTESSSIAPRAA